MLFRKHLKSEQRFDRWRDGLAINGPIMASGGMLMWEGGSLGWHSSAEQMRREGLMPIQAVGDEAVTQMRLAAAWNTFEGIGDDRIGADLLERMVTGSYALALLQRDDLGSGAAEQLNGEHRGWSFPPFATIEAREVADRVAGRGHNYSWGLVMSAPAEDFRGPHFLTAQTFKEADARRLATCWNAMAGLNNQTLSSNIYGRIADLLIQAAFNLASTDLPDGTHDSNQQRAVGRVLAVGTELIRERLASGAFVASVVNARPLERLLQIAADQEAPVDAEPAMASAPGR